MSWINKIIPSIIKQGNNNEGKSRVAIPEGLWKKCPRCDAVLYHDNLGANLDVCPKCDHHMRISARRRLDLFLDTDERLELGADIKPTDILKFKDLKRYRDRLTAATKATGENDALVVMQGQLAGRDLVVAAFEFGFIGGSMGSVVGGKFTMAVNHCLEHGLPLVCFATSGGARMQEALVSLMQMSKTAAALERLKSKGLLYISVLVDPVYGGVSASLAMLGDINIAEPNAFIGFAGQDVIRQTVREQLPEGFQRSEFLLAHGGIDMIVHRHDMRERVASLINKFLPLAPAAAEAVEDPVAVPPELTPEPETEVDSAPEESAPTTVNSATPASSATTERTE